MSDSIAKETVKRLEAEKDELAKHLDATVKTAAAAVAERDTLAAQCGIMREALEGLITAYAADCTLRNAKPDEVMSSPMWQAMSDAQAALSIPHPAAFEAMRREIVEECAKIAETEAKEAEAAQGHSESAFAEMVASEHIATAIRALAPKAPDNT